MFQRIFLPSIMDNLAMARWSSMKESQKEPEKSFEMQGRVKQETQKTGPFHRLRKYLKLLYATVPGIFY